MKMNLLNMPERIREPLEPGDKAYIDISANHNNVVPNMLRLDCHWVTIENRLNNHSRTQGYEYRIVGHSFYWNDHMFSKVIRKNPNKLVSIKQDPELPIL